MRRGDAEPLWLSYREVMQSKVAALERIPGCYGLERFAGNIPRSIFVRFWTRGARIRAPCRPLPAVRQSSESHACGSVSALGQPCAGASTRLASVPPSQAAHQCSELLERMKCRHCVIRNRSWMTPS